MNLEKRTLPIDTANGILHWCYMRQAEFKAQRILGTNYQDRLAVFDMNKSKFGLPSSRFWDKEKHPEIIRVVVNKSNLLGSERAIRTNDWEFIHSVILGNERNKGELHD
jgi:hypothetical protein